MRTVNDDMTSGELASPSPARRRTCIWSSMARHACLTSHLQDRHVCRRCCSRRLLVPGLAVGRSGKHIGTSDNSASIDSQPPLVVYRVRYTMALRRYSWPTMGNIDVSYLTPQPTPAPLPVTQALHNVSTFNLHQWALGLTRSSNPHYGTTPQPLHLRRHHQSVELPHAPYARGLPRRPHQAHDPNPAPSPSNLRTMPRVPGAPLLRRWGGG